jgi:hypothetical protein
VPGESQTASSGAGVNAQQLAQAAAITLGTYATLRSGVSSAIHLFGAAQLMPALSGPITSVELLAHGLPAVGLLTTVGVTSSLGAGYAFGTYVINPALPYIGTGQLGADLAGASYK